MERISRPKDKEKTLKKSAIYIRNLGEVSWDELA